ncbi:9934_t:CDS:2, partial [Gigaspora margarita]
GEIPYNIRKIIKGAIPKWFKEIGEAIKDQENLSTEGFELNPFTLKETKEEDLQNGRWLITKEGLIGRVKNIKGKRIILSHWNTESNVITEKCRGCIEHAATRMTAGLITKAFKLLITKYEELGNKKEIEVESIKLKIQNIVWPSEEKLVLISLAILIAICKEKALVKINTNSEMMMKVKKRLENQTIIKIALIKGNLGHFTYTVKLMLEAKCTKIEIRVNKNLNKEIHTPEKKVKIE